MKIFVLNIIHLGQTAIINIYTRLASHFDKKKERDCTFCGMHISLVECFPHVSSCQASISLIKPPHQSIQHIISVPEPEGTDEPVSPLIVLELDVFARWTTLSVRL